MKKSRKILLYGLMSSILLIILCLYLHQDEFMNEFNDNSLSSDEENISIEQVLKEYEAEKNDDKDLILVDRTKMGEPREIKVESKEGSFVNRVSTLEENTTVEKRASTKTNDAVEKNTTVENIDKNISEDSEEIVDETLPSLDNFPILDDGTLPDESNTTVVETNNSSDASLDLTQETISNLVKSERIHFYKNRAKITKKGKQTLDKVVKILKGIPDVNITIKGYTDASGRRKLNQWISLERAKSVKKYLGRQGIALESIDAQGFGEEGLLYANRPYSRLNRRVEIEIKRK